MHYTKNKGHSYTSKVVFSVLSCFILLFSLLFFSVSRSKATDTDGNDNGNHYGKKYPTPTPTSFVSLPTPTPTKRPIPSGRKRFSSFSFLSEGWVDPYDPAVGSSQTVELHLVDSKGIATVNIVVQTDTSRTTFPLNLATGTSTNGVWQGSWIVNDTYDYTYVESITVVNAEGTVSHVDMTLR